jgi:MFS family permease
MAGSGSASSAWAPLRIGLFRTLWIVALVSNLGSWMQTVGAQWLLVQHSHAAILVSLVQTADALPAVLFALVAGVFADIFDRVKLLVAVLAGMTAAGGALTALTAVHRMPPALLLMFTFVLGTGGILVEPAYQSLVPDMVPRPQVPAASALGSISINLARAIGPAIGGAFIVPLVRARLSANALAAVASLAYAATLAAVALSRSLALTIVVLLPAAVAWTAFLSTVNAALQLFLPGGYVPVACRSTR